MLWCLSPVDPVSPHIPNPAHWLDRSEHTRSLAQSIYWTKWPRDTATLGHQGPTIDFFYIRVNPALRAIFSVIDGRR